MAYNPNIHTATNKPLGIGQAIPTDARSYYYQEDIFKYRPYQDEAEVLAYLNTDATRKGQFSIYINNGTLDETTGEFTGGTVTEYWFKDGVTDSDLVDKGNSGNAGEDLEYIVGTTPGAPTAGTNTFDPDGNLLHGKRIRLLLNKIPVGTLDWNDNPYFSKPQNSNILTLNNATWQTGDLVQIQRY